MKIIKQIVEGAGWARPPRTPKKACLKRFLRIVFAKNEEQTQNQNTNKTEYQMGIIPEQ